MTAPHYADDDVAVYYADCRALLAELPAESVDAVVTDPPYDLTAGKKGGTGPASLNPNSPAGRARISTGGGFMGQSWDATGVAFDPQTWQAVMRVLKPGGHLLAFGGSRTWHRLAVAIEDAGFELRDSIAWIYSQGFPKSLDVSKALDKAAGVEREMLSEGPSATRMIPGAHQNCTGTRIKDSGGVFVPQQTAPVTEAAKTWSGWGTALKPSFEPIVVARKPFTGSVADNVLAHGTGALHIDACRIPTTDMLAGSGVTPLSYAGTNARPLHDDAEPRESHQHEAGRWPTNVMLDDVQAEALDSQSGVLKSGANPVRRSSDKFRHAYGDFAGQSTCVAHRGADEGGASRFFPVFRYESKASSAERPSADGVVHPCVKPLDLMRWLVRLVAGSGGVVLDPFAGSGTTAEACVLEHMRCIAIENYAPYLPLIVTRLTKPLEVGFDFEAPSVITG